MKRIVAALPILLFLVLSSCDNESDCQTQQVPITSLEEKYGCSNTTSEIDIKLPNDQLSNDYIIIHSRSEYDSLVTSTTCNAQIDFSTYDLVIGKILTMEVYSSVDYVLRRPCLSDTLSLTVIFDKKNATKSPTVVSNTTYHALIPKLGTNETVEVVGFTYK